MNPSSRLGRIFQPLRASFDAAADRYLQKRIRAH